jgi:hypothetical protein
MLSSAIGRYRIAAQAIARVRLGLLSAIDKMNVRETNGSEWVHAPKATLPAALYHEDEPRHGAQVYIAGRSVSL